MIVQTCVTCQYAYQHAKLGPPQTEKESRVLLTTPHQEHLRLSAAIQSFLPVVVLIFSLLSHQRLNQTCVFSDSWFGPDPTLLPFLANSSAFSFPSISECSGNQDSVTSLSLDRVFNTSKHWRAEPDENFTEDNDSIDDSLSLADQNFPVFDSCSDHFSTQKLICCLFWWTYNLKREITSFQLDRTRSEWHLDCMWENCM